MDNKVESIKPYGKEGGKTEQVRQMFDSIAPAYDFMNHAMTLGGIDKWWRKVAVDSIKSNRPKQILDVATGTGDFAIKLYEEIQPEHVVGVDLSSGMLDVARGKVKSKGLGEVITFEQGDCLDLKWGDGTFDAVTVAFGVRNFEHIGGGYSEMLRVLRPGGMLCVLELSVPDNRFIRWFYDIYTLHIIPLLGSLKSGDKSAYRYLPESIAACPRGKEMVGLMESAGFCDCQVRSLTMGVCTLYTGLKPQEG